MWYMHNDHANPVCARGTKFPYHTHANESDHRESNVMVTPHDWQTKWPPDCKFALSVLVR